LTKKWRFLFPLVNDEHRELPPAQIRRDLSYSIDFALKSNWASIHKALGNSASSAEKQIRRLYEIVHGIEDRRSSEWETPRSRFAPSLMVRSESEIFALSGPRFALRVYLDDHLGSFVNVRRVDDVTSRLRNTPFVTLAAHHIGEDYTPMIGGGKISDAIRGSAASAVHIADGLLVPPQKLNSEYFILTVDLGREYGEGRAIVGTPFALPLSGIGGGKCAQGAIFMTSALLLGMPLQPRDQWPRVCIHGPGEVTAIVTRRGDNRALTLRGLTMSQIQSYFEQTDRRCLVQGNARQRESMHSRHHYQTIFEAVLRGYLRSGVPVILPVDSNRLGQPNASKIPNPETNHSIVLVGYDRGPKTQATAEFIANNPSGKPFRAFSGQHLWDATFTDETIANDDLGRTICVALPRRINLSLETLVVIQQIEGRRRVEAIRPGVIDLALLLQSENDFNRQTTSAYSVKALISQTGQPFALGEFMLSRIDVPSKRVGLDRLLNADLISDAEREDESLAICWHKVSEQWPHRWCYVQYRSAEWDANNESIWIWDAEAECNVSPWFDPTELKIVYERVKSEAEWHVLAIFERVIGGKWRCVKLKSNRSHEERLDIAIETIKATTPSANQIGKIANRALDLAVITSVSPRSSREAIRALRKVATQLKKRELLVDLFAFMHHDPILFLLADPLERTKLRRNKLSRPEALEMMSRAADQPSRISEVADKLCESCAPNAVHVGARICAMASYLPDVNSEFDFRRKEGLGSILFCVRLASALGLRGHKVNAIQIVCGGRPAGLGRAKHNADDKIHYFALMREEEKAFEHARNSVIELSERLKRDERCGGNRPLSLAVELQSGPLSALNYPDMLVKFMKSLEGTAAWDLVGVNADLAYFHLSGASPLDFEGGEYKEFITDRIVHAHISDRGPGIIGDISLARQHVEEGQTGQQWLRDWVALLNRISLARGPSVAQLKGLPYSGIVSLELEAVRSCQMVGESFREFDRWF
jgi:hypothetical protein